MAKRVARWFICSHSFLCKTFDNIGEFRQIPESLILWGWWIFFKVLVPRSLLRILSWVYHEDKVFSTFKWHPSSSIFICFLYLCSFLYLFSLSYFSIFCFCQFFYYFLCIFHSLCCLLLILIILFFNFLFLPIFYYFSMYFHSLCCLYNCSYLEFKFSHLYNSIGLDFPSMRNRHFLSKILKMLDKHSNKHMWS